MLHTGDLLILKSMKIETKYNLRDVAWFMLMNTPKEYKLAEINISADLRYTKVEYVFIYAVNGIIIDTKYVSDTPGTHFWNRKECRIYKTKQELINSL